MGAPTTTARPVFKRRFEDVSKKAKNWNSHEKSFFEEEERISRFPNIKPRKAVNHLFSVQLWAVRPDVEIKTSPIFPIVAQKVPTVVIT